MRAFSQRKQPQPKVKSASTLTHHLSAHSMPILGRRFLAWGLEVAILISSIAGPVYLGGKFNERTETPTSELTPTLRAAQKTSARLLGVSPRLLPDKVTLLTNLLWSASLGLPLMLATAHLYSISRYGRSWPKRWLGLQVLAINGQMLGWRRSLMREGIGKWCGPLAVAYGAWHLSGAFPGLAILGGLGILALVGESLTSLSNRPRRPWHDWLAGTCVVDKETGAIIRLSVLWEETDNPVATFPQSEALTWTAARGGLTSNIWSPIADEWASTRMRSPNIGIGICILLTLGGLAGGISYYLLEKSQSDSDLKETLYVNLISTLTDPEMSTAAKQTAVLAFGNLPDERVAPLLVSLIAQAEDPEWLDALQQALITQGFEAIPALHRLNQSLKADLAMQGNQTQRQFLVLRLQTVNRILAKLIVLHAKDRPYPLDLSNLHLGYLSSGDREFILVLKKQNLADTQWQGTVLNRAQFQGTQFYSPGNDGHPDTYDDKTSDLSGADLTDADLSGANLFLVRMVSVSLLRAALNDANLRLANLARANLQQARLIRASLEQAKLVEAHLSGADLTEAQLSNANLEDARLSDVDAAGAQLSGAVLRGASVKSADLTDANLTGAVLENTDFTGTRLQGANLRGAKLRNAILKDADLRGVILQGADLYGVDLADAILTEPRSRSEHNFVAELPHLSRGNALAEVDFSHARNIEPQQLSFICTQGGIHPACDLPEEK